MATPGRRKQRYVLDIDDVVKRGLMTKANAEELLRGLNASASTVALSVPVGGTNNGVFTDQQLLKYDAATGKIISAGFTGVLPGGNSVFVPHETGAIYSDQSVDKTSKANVEMPIAIHNLDLPVNSRWSDVLVTFQFAMDSLNASMTGLEVRFGADPTPPVGFIQPDKTLLYQVGASPDNLSVTWQAMGAVPDANAFDDPLIITLFGVPNDNPSYRTVITRASYRGLVPEPAGGGQKGIPVFINPTLVMTADLLAPTSWQTIDLTSMVPENSSAVILSARAESSQYNVADLVVRRSAAAPTEFLLLTSAAAGSGDWISNNNQGIYPFATFGVNRTFQWSTKNNTFNKIRMFVEGYVT